MVDFYNSIILAQVFQRTQYVRLKHSAYVFQHKDIRKNKGQLIRHIFYQHICLFLPHHPKQCLGRNVKRVTKSFNFMCLKNRI